MARSALAASLLLLSGTASSWGAGMRDRGMWVWNTRAAIAGEAARAGFVAGLRAAGVTDVYLYLRAADYTAMEADLRRAVAALRDAGIAAWGLEGYRGYFPDMHGPAGLYRAADALVSYNRRVAPEERFAGFMSDLEPQDGAEPETPDHFHDAVADSKLTAGQAAERAVLLRDWIAMHATLADRMHAAGLKYGATMVSWLDDYYGEEVKATYRGVEQGVMKHIMPLVDAYVVMSYNTNPRNAAGRVRGEAAFADQLPGDRRVLAAIETNAGVGPGVSYADTPGKDSKDAALADMDAISAILESYRSFAGVAIHDWAGWTSLSAH